MADWSYSNEDLREVKRNISLNKYKVAGMLLTNVIVSDDFMYLAEQNFKDEILCENFIKWCDCILFDFVSADYKDEWTEGGARGNKYTLYGDFFIAYISDLEDLLGLVLHEYLHHICDRILWDKHYATKRIFTIKEKNFMEDMYINAWIDKDFPGISYKWQSILSSHDMFHGLIFTDKEIEWNSLLTSTRLLCHNDLTQLYDDLRKDNKDLSQAKSFYQFTTAWMIILNREPKTKHMINNLQINKQEWNYETCTPCEAEAKKRKEEINSS